MVKAKPVGKTGALPKLPLQSVKQSAIHKKKNPKFKTTPTGKVNLINGSNMPNSHNMKPQKQLPKGKNAIPEKSPKQQGGQKGSSKAKNDQSVQAANGKRKFVKDLVPQNEESDSDEDYNEGVVIREEISMVDEDDIDDEVESDDDVPDIFGTSLADDSDEDDDDFDEEDSEEDEEEKEDSSPQKKGIKMFTGVKSKGADLDNSNDSTTLNTSASSTQNSSFTTNDDYNEEDDDDEEDDDQDDVEDEDTDDDESADSEDEDEDDSDEEEEDEEEEESGPGLKALLGNSLADDDDDEDFDGEEEDSEDEDISDEEDDDVANNSVAKTQNEKKAKQDTSPLPHEKHNEKTIFVGNLPVSTKKEQLIKLFKKFGPVQAVRLRGIVPMEEKMPKKVAAITKKIHPKVKTIYAYIIFQKEESAKAALALNGELFEGNHLRVDGTMKTLESNVNPKRSVFLGNLSFKTDNNAIWEHFKDCGDIESVRIVKHNKTGVGKGIGYINFKHEDSVALALKLDGTQLVNREVRVKPYATHDPSSKKPKHEGKKRPLQQGSSSQPKKMKASLENLEQHNEKSQKKKNPVSDDKQTSPQNKGAFQGQKVDAKKKKKPNKLEKQKKIMAAKLTSKSKKPAH